MIRILILALFCIVGISCQTEEHVINNAPQDNLTGNIALATKLAQMVQYPTAIDNVIDGTGCFSIQLPFTVVVNSQTIVVDNVADYQTVRNLLAEDDTNIDTIAIQFPVNVTYADYTTAVMASQAQFAAAVAGCSATTELSCIDLLYPLEVQTYNSDNQLAESFDIGTEEAFYQFLTTLALYDAVTLNYPVAFVNPDGVTVNVNNNEELESAIDSYTDECLVLLNPGADPGNPDLTFEEALTAGTWHVSYFFKDQDETEDYENFDFAFNDSGTITVTGGSSTGSWSTATDDGELELNLNFSSSALEELAEDWTVVSWTETTIELEKISGGGDDIRSLHFTKN